MGKKIENLIEEYSIQGIHLWMEDGKLKYSAPKGYLTGEMLNELKEHKKSIIHFFEKHIHLNHDEENRFKEFELTPLQSAYAMGKSHNYIYGGIGSNFYVELDVSRYNKEEIESAWNVLIKRHDMLRVTISKKWKQKILEDLPMYIIKETYLNKDQEDEFYRIRNKLSTRTYLSDQWPLFDLELSNTDSKKVLHFSIDMIIADAQSVGIILEDFIDVLSFKRKEELEINFKDLIDYYNRERKTPRFVKKEIEDKNYWMEVIKDNPLMPNLPIKISNESNRNILHLRKVVDKDLWGKIKKRCIENNITPTSLLLTLYIELLKKESVNKKFYINLTFNKRNPSLHKDLLNMVGEFTDILLISSEISKEGDLIEKAQGVQKKTWEIFEHINYSGIKCIREINQRYNENRIYPYIFTSTLGNPITLKEDIYVLYRCSQTPQALIDCQIAEINNELEVCWDIREAAFEKAYILGLFEFYIRGILLFAKGECKELEEDFHKKKRKKNMFLRDGFYCDVNEIESEINKIKDVEKSLVVYDEAKKELHAFILPEKIIDSIQPLKQERFLGKTYEQDASYHNKVSNEEMRNIVEQTNDIALKTILSYLIDHDIFAEDRVYSFKEIIKLIDCKTEYEFIIKRWLNKLIESKDINKEVNKDGIVQYYCKTKIKQIDMNYDQIKGLIPEEIYNFLLNSKTTLNKLVSGEKEAREILFPKGDLTKAHIIYNSYVYADLINEIGVKTVLEIIESMDEKEEIKILEIGAGTGSFTDHIIPLLKGHKVSYHYTDVSNIFLNEAKERYHNYSFVKYKLFDLNKEIKAQGFKFNDYDIIISSNVFHNIIDRYQAFPRLKRLLKTEGYMITIDAISESALLLISMAFLYLVDIKDERRDKSEIFYSIDDYYNNFDLMDGELIYEFPANNDFNRFIDQRIFVTRQKSKRKSIKESTISEHLKRILLNPALSDKIHIINEEKVFSEIRENAYEYFTVKTSENEKYDKKHEYPSNELESKVEKIWRKVLNLDKNISVTASFFELGGDSLLLAKLINELQKEIDDLNKFEWEFLVRKFLDNNTIRSFSNFILNEDILNTKETGIRVTIKEENDKHGNSLKKSLVLISDGTGNLFIYNQLIDLLESKKFKGKIIGYNLGVEKDYLEIDDKDLIPFFGEYIAKSLVRHKDENLVLLGHCFGGAVALEASKYLTNKGIEHKLIMIDTKRWREDFLFNEIVQENIFAYLLEADLQAQGYNFNTSILKELSSIGFDVQNMTSNEIIEAIKSKDPSKINKKSEVFYSKDKKLRLEEIVKISKAVDKSEINMKQVFRLYKIMEKSFKAMYKYEPGSYEKELVEFDASSKNKLFTNQVIRTSKITETMHNRQIKTEDIKGDHFSCMRTDESLKKIILELLED